MRMIVADVVDAVAGETIEYLAAILGLEFCIAAMRVLDVHSQRVQQSYPDRVDILGIGAPLVVTRRGSIDSEDRRNGHPQY
jgi:hypothetical protein